MAIIIGGPIAIAFLGLSIFVAFGIPIDLSWLRSSMVAAASDALEREVAIEGPIELVPTSSLTLRVEGIRVGNPTGWQDSEFFALDVARIRLGILPLLRGEVRIDKIVVAGVRANLATNAEGTPNWLTKEREGATAPQGEPSQADLQFTELRELSLTNIAMTYRDDGSGQTYEFLLDEITGSAEYGQPINLFIDGAIQQVPYALTVTAGSLASLFGSEVPWPLEVSATAAATDLTVTGAIAEPLLGKGLNFDFDVRSEHIRELEEILGTKLPAIRSINLGGRFEEADGVYRVTGLQGSLGRTAFSGELEIDTSGTRPRVVGALDIPNFDAGLLQLDTAAEIPSRTDDDEAQRTEESQQAAESTSASGDNVPIDVDAPILTLEPLRNFDANLTVTIREVVNSALAISKASLNVSVQDGILLGPVDATIANVPFAGNIRLAPEDGQPAAIVSLSAEKSKIGELLSVMTGARGIEGSFDVAKLSTSAQGETIRALIESTELQFLISGGALSYGHESGEPPVEFTLDTFEILFPASADSRITANGTLLNEAFSLELTGGTFVENYVEQTWPIGLTASGGGAELQLKGTISDPKKNSGSAFEFSLVGERIGGLAHWIGVAPEADASYSLSGSVTQVNSELIAQIDKAQVGGTAFAGNGGIEIRNGTPITTLALAFQDIDIEGLVALFPEQRKAAAPKSDERAFSIDIPILPRGIELMDSDINVSVERVRMEPSDITEISFSSEIRNGHMENAPVRAVFAGAAIEGTVSGDLRGDDPALDLNLRSTDLDIGDLLARLGIAQGLDITADSFDLGLALRGQSVRSILEHSEFSAGFRDGLLRLRDPNTNGSLDIGISSGTIDAAVGQPIALLLEGRIDRTPIEITIQTDSLASFADKKDQLQARLSVALLNADLILTGIAPLPLQPDNLRFDLHVSGNRVSDFDEFLGVSLPPWGPYQLAGEFGTRQSGYYIQDLELEIGSTMLTGTLDFNTTQTPPRFETEFVASTIQLDDFETGEWSATGTGVEPARGSESDENPEVAIRSLLSPQVMRSLDGTVSIDVEEVLSGQDRLGSGMLVVSLVGGRLAVDPLSVNLPGGNVTIGFAVEPTETDVEFEARATIDRLDYGVLARRIDPQSTTGGLISVDVDLTARGTDLSNVMAGSNGRIDFAVWPQDLNAGLFDLWAVNLFTAILPSLDSDSSNVNCVVGRFTLDEGLMRPSALLIDTSRIQASGDGTIDFRNNTIDFGAAPVSKRPQLFSAETPIRVAGHFSDFEVDLTASALAGTIVRMITGPVLLPFRWVFTENEPPDGSVACKKAWGRGFQHGYQ